MMPDPNHVRGFSNPMAFEAWLSVHHETETEIWLKLARKGAGVPTITYAEALEVALCWGWIDGQKQAHDATAFLQRFSPRKPKSIWSQVNIGHVERLTAAGRMTPHGRAAVEAAIADGRWAAAYAGSSKMAAPQDLLAAIAANPAAQASYDDLNRQNRFALAFRVGNLKTAAGRARKIAGFVEMLARGETLYPNGDKK